MLPLPHCQCVQKATPRLRICNSRTRRYAIPADPVAETSESLSPIFRLKPVDHIYSFGSGHRIPGPRIALRVARRMSCTQCRVIMVICPGFQRRLQMCHGTKTGLLVGWVVSSSVEPVLTYCCTKYTYTHASFYRSADAGQRSATLPASHWTQGRLCSQHTSDPAVILLKGGRVGRGPRRDRIGKQCLC